MEITSFRGEYDFLSNFYPATVNYAGYLFLNNEAAFQAMKDLSRAGEFVYLTAVKAKRLGRQVTLRPDWDEVKLNIMYEICLAKFTQHPNLKQRLLATGDATLVEGNEHGDKFWGVCGGEGRNELGKILMRVRCELGGV